MKTKEENIIEIIKYIEENKEATMIDIYEWVHKKGLDNDFLEISNMLITIMDNRKMAELEQRIIKLEEKIK